MLWRGSLFQVLRMEFVEQNAKGAPKQVQEEGLHVHQREDGTFEQKQDD